MKNDFYFTSKALFVLKIFKFLSWLFRHVLKWLDKKDKVDFKFYEVTAWLTNNCNTHIAQYLEKWRQSDNEIWSVNRMSLEKHFSWSYTKCGGETSTRPFSEKLKLSISLGQQSKGLYSLFLLYGKLRAIEIYWNKVADHFLLYHIKQL